MRIKAFILCTWIFLLLVGFIFIYISPFNLHHFSMQGIRFLDNLIDKTGIWGPIIFMMFYIVRPLIFFPSTLLALFAGLAFGFVEGVIYTFLGEMVSSHLAFLLARWMRPNSKMRKNKKKFTWLRVLNDEIREKGFMTTLILRLSWAPFDAVNYGLGMSKISLSSYFWGTMLGIIPSIIAVVYAGSVMGMLAHNHLYEIVFPIILCIGLIVLSAYFAWRLKQRYKRLEDAIENENL